MTQSDIHTKRSAGDGPGAGVARTVRFERERIAVASLFAAGDDVKSEVARLAALAGVEVSRSRSPSGANAVLRMTEVPGAELQIEASFHPSYAPYFASGKVRIVLPEQAEDLLELLLAAGSTRRGTIVGVFASHGGAGSSTLASWLARRLGESDSTGLIDLDPMSSGLDRDLGLLKTPGLRWADLSEKSGALVPGRLNAALPRVDQLHVLSADERAGAPVSGSSGERAIAALSQVNAVTVLDLPRQATQEDTRIRGWLEWCDVAVVVMRAHARGLRHTRRILDQLPEGIVPIVVVNGVSGGSETAAIAVELDCERVLPLRRLRNLEQDLEHGVRLGDRRRCNTARDVARIEALCLAAA
ncbi:hypothetical protein VR010_11395 [Actinomycetaceae bacterium L2_0104]